MRYVVTGGNGFFGRILVKCLLRRGEEVFVIDRLADPSAPAGVRFAHADLRDSDRLYRSLREFQPVDGVFHLAAILAHEKKQRFMLWDSNVEGTGNLLNACVRLGVPKLVFTSSNCVFSRGSKLPVNESAPPQPIEIYGRSKLEAEKRIIANGRRLPYCIIRCPTIVGAGRLGLLTILFDFIRENRRVYVVGKGENRYQFVYAQDLAAACVLAMRHPDSAQLFHIGSEHVPTVAEAYRRLIEHARSGSRLVCLPRRAALSLMRIAYWTGASPLGPYHYRMIAEDFIFDAAHIRKTLGWAPTLTNSEMLIEAYDWYLHNYGRICRARDQSAHRSPVPQGIISLLRALS